MPTYNNESVYNLIDNTQQTVPYHTAESNNNWQYWANSGAYSPMLTRQNADSWDMGSEHSDYDEQGYDEFAFEPAYSEYDSESEYDADDEYYYPLASADFKAELQQAVEARDHRQQQAQQAIYRADLNQERATVYTELKGYQQMAASLEDAYRAQKVKNYNGKSYVSSMFSSAAPSEDRLNAIHRIQEIAKGVDGFLENLNINPQSFEATDQTAAIRYHIHQMSQAVLAIKGAAQQEFGDIKDSYKVRAPSNAALHSVLEKHFGCSEATEVEQNDASRALDAVKAQLHSQNVLQDDAQPTAFVA